jgi:hypothetical protein
VCRRGKSGQDVCLSRFEWPYREVVVARRPTNQHPAHTRRVWPATSPSQLEVTTPAQVITRGTGFQSLMLSCYLPMLDAFLFTSRSVVLLFTNASWVPSRCIFVHFCCLVIYQCVLGSQSMHFCSLLLSCDLPMMRPGFPVIKTVAFVPSHAFQDSTQFRHSRLCLPLKNASVED